MKKSSLYFGIGCVAVWVWSMSKLPRGIRLNNPGNIRHGDSWDGMTALQPDPDFVQFESPAFGIRAMSKILDTYSRHYGLNTINSIVGRWAPPVENNTGAYVAHVAQKLGVSPHQPLNIDEYKPELIAAIILHENGQQPYSMQQIYEGIAMS